MLLGRYAEPHQVVAGRARDRQNGRVAVEVAKRKGFEHPRQDRPEPPELAPVEIVVHVVHQHHTRLPQPERREERDAVDDLEHHVGVASDAAQHRPDGAGKDRDPAAHAMDHEVGPELLHRLRPRIVPPTTMVTLWPHATQRAICATDLVPLPPLLGMSPVPVRQHEDVQRLGVSRDVHSNEASAPTGTPVAANRPPGASGGGRAAERIVTRRCPSDSGSSCPRTTRWKTSSSSCVPPPRSSSAWRPRAGVWWSWTTPHPTEPAPSAIGCPTSFSEVEVLHRAGKDGLGKAYLAGFEYALARGAELVVVMDADFSHDPEHLPALVEAAADSDLVLGSRYVPGGKIVGWPPCDAC